MFWAGAEPKFVRYIVSKLFVVPGSTIMGDCCDPQVDPITEIGLKVALVIKGR
jgi:hypothetical protein